MNADGTLAWRPHATATIWTTSTPQAWNDGSWHSWP
jgi:hypothetical protein